jgi:hypothetical protein
MAAILLLSAALAGCGTTKVNMFPVQGPMASIAPVPSLIAKVDGIFGNTGNFQVDLPGGVSCRGKWSSAAPQFAAISTGSLFSQYGSIAGISTTVGSVPGVNSGQAFAPCSDGNAIEVEFVTGSGTANGYGVAKDKNGNVFKLIF